MTTTSKALERWLDTTEELTGYDLEDLTFELRLIGLPDAKQQHLYMRNEQFGVAFEEFRLAQIALEQLSTKPQFRAPGDSYSSPVPFSVSNFAAITMRLDEATLRLRELCAKFGVSDLTL
jgi:hypothetical protein